jgi:hypothetical protein
MCGLALALVSFALNARTRFEHVNLLLNWLTMRGHKVQVEMQISQSLRKIDNLL